MINKGNTKVQLGKGIGALLASENLGQEDFKVTEKVNLESKNQGTILVPITKLFPRKDQPRKIFKEKELVELASSIREMGIIQPLVVSEVEGGFQIIAGERRYRAAKMVGLEHLPVTIKRATEQDKKAMALIENIQRSNLNCIEEALAYYDLLNEHRLTQEEIAKKVGKDRSTIANFLRILKLPKDVLAYLQDERLSFGHAKVLAALTDADKAIRLAHAAVSRDLSVRELEKLIKFDSLKKTEVQPSPQGEKWDAVRSKLEKNTGFHFAIKANAKGKGQITIKFSNEAEFNDIFNFLMK